LPADYQERSQAEVQHPWLIESTPVVMGVGRLARQKGFDVLLPAFASLRRQLAVKLILVGEGAERAALQQQAEDLGIAEDVDLVGSVPDVFPWLRRASLYVLSSRYEGLPNVLIEALAAGAPVVSTDCPSGPREILEEGRLGPLVPVDDAEPLAAAMERTLQRPPPAGETEASLERFRSDRVAAQYLEFMGLNGPSTGGAR
ncbi:glycosyltransferase, partial [Thiohalospira sp.]|uniref:glycosyltransferase n=1 Tax=Thiohalospira sp. TaxID=3080549 RepID=UPI00398021E8